MSTLEEKEAKRKAEIQLAGQSGSEARQFVKIQRELKKKRDAMRKTEKKLKGLPEGSSEYAATQSEVSALMAGIAQMERQLGIAPTPAPESANKAPTTGPNTITGSSGANASATRADHSPSGAHASTAGGKTRALDANGAGHSTSSASARRGANASTDSKFIGSSNGSGMTAASATAVSSTPPGSTVEHVEAAQAYLIKLVDRARHLSSAEPLLVQRTNSVVHPRVAEVTLMMEEMRIFGGNARTLAMIHAFREMITATTVLAGSTTQDIDITAFEQLVEANFMFMRRRRDATSGMHYVKEVLLRRLVAVRDKAMQLKNGTGRGGANGWSSRRISCYDSPNEPSSPTHRVAGGGGGEQQQAVVRVAEERMYGDARETALHILGAIELELKMSLKSIVDDRSEPYVSSSDVILVFGRSSAVELILLARIHDAARKPKKVIVLDSAPLFEGRALAFKLSEAGMDVTYGLISACCTLMPRCTRVFIGASSVLQNGDVFGRCGTALVATCAKSFHKPVLCFCESYKFVSAVWVGNLAQNAKLIDICTSHEMTQVGLAGSGGHETSGGSLGGRRVGSAAAMAGGGMSGMRGTFCASTMHCHGVVGGGGSVTTSRAPSPHMNWSTAWVKGSVPANEVNVNSFLASASGYLYDLTPASYVDMIICEMGCLHTSAIVAAIQDREGRDSEPLLYMVKS